VGNEGDFAPKRKGGTHVPVSRRSVLAVASAGVALSQNATSAKAAAQGGPAIDQAIAELVQRSAQANAALMRGEITKYYEVIPHTDDFMLMSPFGGKPTRGSELTLERIEAMGRFFKNGTFEQELLQAYGSTDMVVLATVERAHVEVGGLPAQDWALRVTLVYRREGADWRLVHRHADPLANGVSLEQAAALARIKVP
jgi:ketosteroid isomerase-like protein